MNSNYSQQNQMTPPPPQGYPPEGHPQAYPPPPPPGYPQHVYPPPQNYAPAQTQQRGDGFWKGCCAALCCCCMLDACF